MVGFRWRIAFRIAISLRYRQSSNIHAIVHMWERHGARGFMTGVRANNSSSQALCRKLGVNATDWIYAACTDKELFGGS